MAQFRIDKYLADMGIGTRSEIKAYIKKGRVRINNNVVTSADIKINSDCDIVFFDNNQIGYVETEYYMLNKPAGIISASMDKKASTVVDLITTRNRKDLFPVGRLDKDTEGLLIISNDGKMAHNLLSPKKHISKLYYVEIDSVINSSHIKEFEEGIAISENFKALPSKLEIIDDFKDVPIELQPIIPKSLSNPESVNRCFVTIMEGKFHQIKKMFEHYNISVTYLKRLKMGELVLDSKLGSGEYRNLREDEINLLKNYN